MNTNKSRGFTLLEALVAILVISVGLIGVAFIQLKSLQSASLSTHRTIATLAAQDAVERLWSAFGDGVGVCPAPSVVYSDWFNVWSEKLPQLSDSASSIDNSSHACEYVISISWVDERFQGEMDVSRLVYKFRLPGGA